MRRVLRRVALRCSLGASDNTAADALLRAHGIRGMRVDRGEGALAREFAALGDRAKPPADETPVQRLARLRRGYAEYLGDARDRASPEAAVGLLRLLWHRDLLSSDSTRYLLELMSAQIAPARLRAGLPAGVRIADQCGTSYEVDGRVAAYNDIGVLSLPDGRAVIVAGFPMDSPAAKADRERIFTDLARVAVERLRSPEGSAVAEGR